MELSCPVCSKTDKLELIKEEKKLTIRNEPISVEIEYYKCHECGDEFLVPDKENDPFEYAYRIYRSKHNMLQPEEIRNFRHKYHLTQSDLANLLGLGGATISRYETGKLQDETHDTLLRLAMDPKNLQRLVTSRESVLSEDRKKMILNALEQTSAPKASSLEFFVLSTFQDYGPNEYSGFKNFDRDKFFNAILFLCRDGEFKTKLNKLLFYVDFKHFKEYTTSITGAQYAHIPFGPAPDNYDLYYPILIRQDALEIEEVDYPGFSGERLIAKRKPDLNVFSDSELHIMTLVKEHFKEYDASRISDYSHKEKGYRDTEIGKSISYRYAESLTL
jgi:putative zinc finger/helix-turn-helix YgiT family protein